MRPTPIPEPDFEFYYECIHEETVVHKKIQIRKSEQKVMTSLNPKPPINSDLVHDKQYRFRPRRMEV
jgi:hypothetical protein